MSYTTVGDSDEAEGEIEEIEVEEEEEASEEEGSDGDPGHLTMALRSPATIPKAVSDSKFPSKEEPAKRDIMTPEQELRDWPSLSALITFRVIASFGQKPPRKWPRSSSCCGCLLTIEAGSGGGSSRRRGGALGFDLDDDADGGDAVEPYLRFEQLDEDISMEKPSKGFVGSGAPQAGGVGLSRSSDVDGGIFAALGSSSSRGRKSTDPSPARRKGPKMEDVYVPAGSIQRLHISNKKKAKVAALTYNSGIPETIWIRLAWEYEIGLLWMWIREFARGAKIEGNWRSLRTAQKSPKNTLAGSGEVPAFGAVVAGGGDSDDGKKKPPKKKQPRAEDEDEVAAEAVEGPWELKSSLAVDAPLYAFDPRGRPWRKWGRHEVMAYLKDVYISTDQRTFWRHAMKKGDIKVRAYYRHEPVSLHDVLTRKQMAILDRTYLRPESGHKSPLADLLEDYLEFLRKEEFIKSQIGDPVEAEEEGEEGAAVPVAAADPDSEEEEGETHVPKKKKMVSVFKNVDFMKGLRYSLHEMDVYFGKTYNVPLASVLKKIVRPRRHLRVEESVGADGVVELDYFLPRPEVIRQQLLGCSRKRILWDVDELTRTLLHALMFDDDGTMESWEKSRVELYESVPGDSFDGKMRQLKFMMSVSDYSPATFRTWRLREVEKVRQFLFKNGVSDEKTYAIYLANASRELKEAEKDLLRLERRRSRSSKKKKEKELGQRIVSAKANLQQCKVAYRKAKSLEGAMTCYRELSSFCYTYRDGSKEDKELLRNAAFLKYRARWMASAGRHKLLDSAIRQAISQKIDYAVVVPVRLIIARSLRVRSLKAAFAVGNCVFRWTSDSLSVFDVLNYPRNSPKEFVFFCGEVPPSPFMVVSQDRIRSVLTKMSREIIACNVNLEYRKIGDGQDSFNTRQMALHTIISHLGVFLPAYMVRFFRHACELSHAIEDGEQFRKQIFSFFPSRAFRHLFRQHPRLLPAKKTWKVFLSHKDLDAYVQKLLDIRPTLPAELTKDWGMLKGLDRAFWLDQAQQTVGCPFNVKRTHSVTPGSPVMIVEDDSDDFVMDLA